MSALDKCHFCKTDCFAYGLYARCSALSDTMFESDNCPFYKNKEQRWKEHHESVRHLHRTGQDDLIYKYGEQPDQKRIWRDIDGSV